MHFLFITSLVTSGAPESGYEIANAALLDGLRRQGAKVTEIGYKWVGTTLSDPQNAVCLGDVDVKTDDASGGQKIKWLAQAVAGGLTFACAKLRIVDEAQLEAAYREAELRNGPINGVILNGVALAGAYETYFTKAPFIFIAHNVEHVSAGQNAEDASGLIEKLMYRREAVYLKKLEQRLCSKAAHVLTLTEDDRAGLQIDDDTRSTAVALVTPQPIATPEHGRIKAFDIGLIGTWTWTPNRIGLEWFLRDVVPHLPEGTKVAVAGKTPRGLRARDKKVTFLGRVVDAKDFCRQNRVIALTSRVGTGVQLKTIEAFEMGLPCVATSSSMRGISHIPENVTVADRPKAFADALVMMAAADKAGTLAKPDGTQFRAGQLAQMDKALSKVLSLFADGSAR